MNSLNIDSAYEAGEELVAAHNVSPSEFLDRVIGQQEPLYFASKYPVKIGERVFVQSNPGAISNFITREDFISWEKRIFPGKDSMLDKSDIFFFEVKVD